MSSFEVGDGAFWVVEVKESEHKAWVHDSETGAIDELLQHIPIDDLTPETFDADEFAQTYSIQRVQISGDSYQMAGIPLVNIFMRAAQRPK